MIQNDCSDTQKLQKNTFCPCFYRFLFSLLIFLSGITITSAQWLPVGNNGGVASTANVAGYSSLAIASNGVPYIALRSGGVTVVRKFENGVWQNVGSPGFATGGVTKASLAIAPNGIPYFGYSDNINGYKATVLKFINGSWQTVGSANFSAAETGSLSLSIDKNNIPYVGYVDGANGSKTTVQKFVNGSWQYVGIPGFSPSNIDEAAFAVAPDGTPYMAWEQNDEASFPIGASVMKFTNGSWQYAGSSIITQDDQTLDMSLAINASGIPYIAYMHFQSAAVLKFENGSWQYVGGAGFSGYGINALSFALAPDGTPYAGYWDYNSNDNKATVKKYANGLWQTVGDAGFSAGTPYYTSLAVAPDATPYFAYTDAINNPVAIVSQYLMNPVVTKPLSSSSLCTGGNVYVSFTASGSYNAGNVFTAQLSNASGSFANPVSIGTLSSTSSSGVIQAALPASTPVGSGYRIRTSASNPPVAGSDNGTNLTIATPVTYYRDDDNDGFGDKSNTTLSCSGIPSGYVADNTDCNDSNKNVHPGARDVRDNADNDCDGQIDEDFFTLSITDVKMNEGDSGKSNMTFTVSLNKKASRLVTVNCTTQNGTATTMNNDYTARSGKLTFKAGVLKQKVTVSITGDKVKEADETFTIVLSNPYNASLLRSTATGTIVNDDGSSGSSNRVTNVTSADQPGITGKVSLALRALYLQKATSRYLSAALPGKRCCRCSAVKAYR